MLKFLGNQVQKGRTYMSGHSKWHNIQKTKGAADAKRAQAFTKIAREMIVAVKEGGSGDLLISGKLPIKGSVIPILERRISMTTKELLYVDDALSHAQLLATQFENAAGQLQDNSLRTQVQQMAQRHRQVYQQFYDLV